jgi:hypothetical protein
VIHMHTARIKVEFDEEPKFSRKPPCPQRFIWQKKTFQIEEMISEWRTEGQIKAKLRYIGVARVHFRVRVINGRIFDIYYDPRSKAGEWILSAEILS